MAVLARFAAALGLLTVLAACARAPDADSEMLAEIVESQRASMAALGRPMAPAAAGRLNADAAAGRLTPDTPAGRFDEAAAAARPMDTARPPPRGPAPGESNAFIGATPEILRRWLGEPRLMRMEGEAQVWLYQGTHCHFDLVLYPDRGALRVAYAAARASGTERRTEAACLSDLARPMARAGG